MPSAKVNLSADEKADLFREIVKETVEMAEEKASELSIGDEFEIKAQFVRYRGSAQTRVHDRLVLAIKDELPVSLELLGSAGPFLRLKVLL